MAYGLQVYDANGGLQLDTTKSGYSAFAVIAAGASSSVPNVNNDTDIIFANMTVTSGNYKVLTSNYVAGGGSTYTKLFYDEYNQAAVANYVHVRRTSDITSPTGGYGILIYNNDGDIEFDSRLYEGNGGFNVTGYVESNTKSGMAFYQSGTYDHSPITTDLSVYVDMSRTSGQAPVNVFGTDRARYVGYVFFNNFNGSPGSIVSNGGSGTISRNGVYWSRQKSGNAGPDTVNYSDIIYGEKT